MKIHFPKTQRIEGLWHKVTHRFCSGILSPVSVLYSNTTRMGHFKFASYKLSIFFRSKWTGWLSRQWISHHEMFNHKPKDHLAEIWGTSFKIPSTVILPLILYLYISNISYSCNYFFNRILLSATRAMPGSTFFIAVCSETSKYLTDETLNKVLFINWLTSLTNLK